MENLDGKVAFITGGASGIGLGIPQACREAGMKVVLADVDTDTLTASAAQLGSAAEVLPVVLDVRDRIAWQQAVVRAEAAFGAVHLLCNNAGIGPDGRELAQMTAESWDRIVAINLTGAFNGVQTFAAGMQARREGHIVNVASMAGLLGTAGLGGYTATKFALVGFSEVLRAELAAHGVGVSIACPGATRSRLAATSAQLSDGVARVGRDAAHGVANDYPHGSGCGSDVASSTAYAATRCIFSLTPTIVRSSRRALPNSLRPSASRRSPVTGTVPRDCAAWRTMRIHRRI